VVSCKKNDFSKGGLKTKSGDKGKGLETKTRTGKGRMKDRHIERGKEGR